MKKLLSQKVLLIAGLVFIVVLVAIIVISQQLGVAYRNITNVTSGSGKSQEVNNKKKETLRKITLRKKGATNCIEVRPDGVVKIYTQCGDNETAETNRTVDFKNIQQLFRIVSETDLAKYQQGGGDIYELTVETDTGTHTYYLVSGGGTTDIVDDIIETIENIEEDLPNSSPSPIPSGVNASPYVYPSSSVPGASPYIPGASAAPSPSQNPEIPFACDFSETSTGKKPMRVSNIVCTSDPSPIPF